MRIVKGKKVENITFDDWKQITEGFARIYADVGTGNGRSVLKLARRDSKNLYVGVDPVAPQIAECAVRARKEKLDNALFVVAAAEALPDELNGAMSAVTVCLPWGSLRDGIVKAEPSVMSGLRKLGRLGAELTVWIGYEEQREDAEIRRHNLPPLSEGYFRDSASEYRDAGFSLSDVSTIGNSELRELESDWAARLASGKPRQIFLLRFLYI